MWSVYIIRCADDTLYTGITRALDRRLREHASGGQRAARYLRGRGPLRLVFSHAVADRATAMRMEHRIKKLPRRSKDLLISGKLPPDTLEHALYDR